jgi:hypothetical protein
LRVDIGRLLNQPRLAKTLLLRNRATAGQIQIGKNSGSGLSEPVEDQLITRVGWNEAPVGPIENLINRPGERAERVNDIVFVFPFNPVQHGLLDDRAFVNSVHSVISFGLIFVQSV